MEGEGILKACTMKLVPNSARITVTRSDSAYSRKLAPCFVLAGWGTAAPAVADILDPLCRRARGQLLQRQARGGDFRLLLAKALGLGKLAALGADLDAKCF